MVIGQKPNLLFYVLACSLAARFALSRHGGPGKIVRATGATSLFLWSLDEVVRGVNPFRRIGGAIVLLAAPFSRILRS